MKDEKMTFKVVDDNGKCKGLIRITDIRRKHRGKICNIF